MTEVPKVTGFTVDLENGTFAKKELVLSPFANRPDRAIDNQADPEIEHRAEVDVMGTVTRGKR